MADDPYSWDAWDQRQSAAAQPVASPQRDADLAQLNNTIYGLETDSGRNVHTSSAGARGPMQILPSTFEQYAQPGEDIDDPDDNKAVGQRIIADLYDRYGGDKDKVLVGYNGGERHIGQDFDNLPRETQNYLANAHRQWGEGGDEAYLGAMGDGGPNPHRPVPAPQPTQPGVTEPKVVGPFTNSYDAYEAAPTDRENYYLLNRGGSWLWQPKGPGTPADQDPTKASPYLDDTASGHAMDAKVFQAPGLAGNSVGNGVVNIGRLFNRSIANVLDLPATVADWGLKAIAAGTGYKPTFQFGHPVEGLMNRLGFETDKQGDDGWANFGAGIGSGLGMVATMMIPGGAAAGRIANAARAGEAAPGIGTQALARGTGFGRGVTTGAAANEAAMGGAAGLGQEEAHEVYKAQTGREGDFGDIASQFLGGGAFNAVRIPILAAAEKAGLTAVGQAWQGAKAGVASLKGGAGAEADAPLDAVTGKKVTDQVLGEQLARYLDHADQTHAALGTEDPANSASYLAERSGLARAAVDTFGKNSRTEERAMWAEVNPDTQIDYSGTRQLYQSEKAAHFGEGPGTLRDTEDFPTWLEPLLSKNTSQQPTGLLDAQGQPIMRPGTAGDGLGDIDTLGRGQNLRARLNQAIEDERMASGRAQNPALIGYMQRIRNSLGQDMQDTAGGVDNNEIDAYRRAMAFSASRTQIMESQPMSDFLSKRVGDASALQKFLRRGPAGADAVKAMLGAAQAKYGSGGLLNASKDAIRQMYTDTVAPRGFVDVNAHNTFMKNYGAVLNDPAFSDVQQQLNTAANAARDVNNTLGTGEPTNFGRSENALDARTAAAQNYLNAPTETVLRNLQGSSNPLHSTLRALDQLDSADATGRAGLGFQHQIAQEALNNPGWADGNRGIINAIDRRNPGFANRVAKYTSSGAMAGILNQVYNMANAWVGARIGGHAGEGIGSSMVLAGRGAKITEGMGQQLKGAVTKISSANIVDPAADAAWDRLTSANQGRLYTAAQKAADMVLMHSYVPGLALGNLPIGSRTGTGDAGDRMGPSPGSVPWQQLVPGAAQGGQSGGQNPFPQAAAAAADQMPDEGPMQGQAHLLPKYDALGKTRPLGPGEWFQNTNGSWSNEISTTTEDPKLNKGKPTVIPTLWLKNSVPTRVSEDEATELAIKSGLKFPSFADEKTAGAFATTRETNWQNVKPGDTASVPSLWKRR